MSRELKDFFSTLLYKIDDALERNEDGELMLQPMTGVQRFSLDIEERIEVLERALRRAPGDIETQLRHRAEIRLLETILNIAWSTAEDIEDFLERQ